jgi:hypothetical protein
MPPSREKQTAVPGPPVRTVLLSVLVLTLVCALGPLSLQPHTGPEIAIKIASTRKHYVSGERVRIHVELTNLGNRDLLVGRELTGYGSNPADITFQAWNSDGKALPGQKAARDCVLRQNPDSVATAVLKRWIALPPASSYVSTVDFGPSPPLEAPGRYRIVATYESEGVEAQYWSDCLRATQEEIANLPFAAWKGSVDSNAIWIEVARPPGGRGP